MATAADPLAVVGAKKESSEWQQLIACWNIFTNPFPFYYRWHRSKALPGRKAIIIIGWSFIGDQLPLFIIVIAVDRTHARTKRNSNWPAATESESEARTQDALSNWTHHQCRRMCTYNPVIQNKYRRSQRPSWSIPIPNNKHYNIIPRKSQL